MWRRLLGYLLILGAAAIVVVAIVSFRRPQAGAWQLLGPLFLALLFVLQGRRYLQSNQQPAAPLSAAPLAAASANVPASDFDPALRTKLVEKLQRMTGPKVIPAGEFFEGNYSDQGAMGPNLWPEHPGIAAFASCFKALMSRDDVEAIYVEVAEVEPDNDSWPYSDRVYIFGDIPDETIREQTKSLRPTEIGDRKDRFSPISKSVRALSRKPLHVLWWD